MDDNMQNNQSEVAGIVKKSKKPAAIIAAVTAVVLVGGCGVAYATVPAVQNTVKMTIMSPEKYCADVYDNCIEKLKESTDKQYKSISGGDDKLENTSASITLNAELSDSVMSVVEDELGYKIFDKISLSSDMYSDMDESTGEIKLNILADDDSVISANVITDLKEKMIYCQVPELNDKYISYDLSSAFEEMELSEDDIGSLSDISVYDFNDSMPRYAKVLTDVIKNSECELEKGYEGSVRGVDYKYNKIITTLDQDDYEDLLNNLADEWENDKTFRKYFIDTLKISEEDYEAFSDELRDAADEVKDEDIENTIETLVDSKGNIRGITITDEDTDDEISFISAKDGSDVAIELNCADEFIVGIEAEEDDGEYTGELVIEADDESFSITFDDFKMIDDKFISGSIGLDLSDLGVGKVSLDFEKADDAQRISTEMNFIGKFSIDIKQEYNTDKKEVKVPEDAISTDDIDQYIEGIDKDKAISAICDALKIKEEDSETIIQGVMDLFDIGGMSGYEDDYNYDFDDDYDYDDDDFDYGYDDNELEVEYKFNDIDININNEKISFPAINPSLVPEKSKSAMVEPGEYTSIYDDGQSYSLSVSNDTENPLTVPECSLVGINIYGENAKSTVNGVKIGSSVEDIKNAFGITDEISEDVTSIYFSDSDGTFSSVALSIEDGKVTYINIYCFDF